MDSFIVKNRMFSKSLVIPVAIFILFLLLSGCVGDKKDKPIPVIRDGYSFYVLDPGIFSIIKPDGWSPSQKEFLILEADGVEFSVGRLVGGMFAEDGGKQIVINFAQESMLVSNWLPGCWKFLLDAGEFSVGGRWFYQLTMLVRRDPEMTSRLTNLQLITHARDIERFEMNRDMIVRVYYTVKDRDIYIMTLSGKPQDVAAVEPETRKLLSNIRLSAQEFQTETGTLPVGEE